MFLSGGGGIKGYIFSLARSGASACVWVWVGWSGLVCEEETGSWERWFGLEWMLRSGRIPVGLNGSGFPAPSSPGMQPGHVGSAALPFPFPGEQEAAAMPGADAGPSLQILPAASQPGALSRVLHLRVSSPQIIES